MPEKWTDQQIEKEAEKIATVEICEKRETLIAAVIVLCRRIRDEERKRIENAVKTLRPMYTTEPPDGGIIKRNDVLVAIYPERVRDEHSVDAETHAAHEAMKEG